MIVFLILLAVMMISASYWLKLYYSGWRQLPAAFKAFLVGGSVFTVLNCGYLAAQFLRSAQSTAVMFGWAVFALIFSLLVFSKFRSAQ